MRAPFIVVEGLDGTGKSTLAAHLAERLGATLLRTPATELSTVRPVVDEAFAQSPVAAQLFYGATVVLASDRARTLLAQGTPVVIDRYWLSTVVYAACRDAHIDLSPVEPVLLRPDLTVFVDADVAVPAEARESGPCGRRSGFAATGGSAPGYPRAFLAGLPPPIPGGCRRSRGRGRGGNGSGAVSAGTTPLPEPAIYERRPSTGRRSPC